LTLAWTGPLERFSARSQVTGTGPGARAYGYGENPVTSLAATLIELGRLDEAIRVCEEGDEEEIDFCVEPILAEARRLKAGGEPPPEPVPGGRRIKLPIRVTGRPGESVPS
jgi:hypothetical protein